MNLIRRLRTWMSYPFAMAAVVLISIAVFICPAPRKRK